VKNSLPRDQLEHKIVGLHDMSGTDIRIAQLLFDYSRYSCYVDDGVTLEVGALLSLLSHPTLTPYKMDWTNILQSWQS
jgi:hypothetical protein